VTLTVNQPIYEKGWLAQATGGALRPGGLELTRRLLALCDLSPHARILDAGCGSGATLDYLRGAGFTRALGIDRSETLLQSGARRLRVACTLGDCLPFEGDQMDAILAECSLSAMGNPHSTLAEFRRVLRPGGWLLLNDVYAREPQGVPALRALPLSCGLGGALTQTDLAAHLQAHGFEILTWEDCSAVLKYLTAQIIWNHGSLSQFWRRAEPGADPAEILSAVSRAKVGYYLLVARRDGQSAEFPLPPLKKGGAAQPPLTPLFSRGAGGILRFSSFPRGAWKRHDFEKVAYGRT
jgi:SAM-dependent methyltransferase